MSAPRKRQPRFRIAAAATVLFATMMATACGSAGAAPAITPTATEQGATGTSETYELRVTDPGNSGWLAAARRDGVFEAALEPLDVTVNWVPAKGAVSANLPLFATGEIQVSEGAYTPVVGNASNDAPIRIGAIVASETRGKSSGIVASTASGVTKIEDLVGKSITVNPAGKGEYIVLQALRQAGIDPDSVELQYLQPSDGLAAFKAGKVDAIATFGEFFRQAQADATIVATEQDIDSQDEEIILFTTDLLNERPDIAKAFVEAAGDVVANRSVNPEDYVNVFDSTGPRAISGEALEWQLEVFRSAPATVRFATEQDRIDLQSVIDLFAERGVIREGVKADDLIADLG